MRDVSYVCRGQGVSAHDCLPAIFLMTAPLFAARIATMWRSHKLRATELLREFVSVVGVVVVRTSQDSTTIRRL